MAREVLMIIDGNALLHRAWHAIPPLTTSSGEVVNAVYGFTTVLLKALKDLKPTHALVCFDRKAPTFRHDLYAEYKATRKKQPDELYQQIDRIKELLAGLGIPVFEKDGYEADDLIATICALVEKNHPEVEKMIVSGDMDLLQLIDEQTKVYTLRKGIADTVVYDSKAVGERFEGLLPSQMVYYKALRGDPSDNIPGVKGIGEKTAINIIKECGSLEELYKKLDEGAILECLKGALLEKLKAQREDVFKTLFLVRLVKDAPIDFSLEMCKLGGYSQEKLVSLFHALEFRSLIPRLSDLPGFAGTSTYFENDTREQAERKMHYTLLDTEEAIKSFFKDLSKQAVFSFDTETTSERPFDARLVGMSFSWQEGEAWYIPWDISGDWKEILKEILENPAIHKVGQNIKYDKEIMDSVGIDLSGVVFDTMLAAYILNPGIRDYSLDSLTFAEFGYQKIAIGSLIGKGKTQVTMADVPRKDVSVYACEDADFTFRLYHVFQKQLKEMGQEELFNRFELPLLDVLVAMEKNGVLLDSEYLSEYSKNLAKLLKESEQKIYALAGEEFNIASPLQMKKILFDKLQLSTMVRIRKGKNGFSTAASELEKMKSLHPIIECIMQYRELAKLLNTYVLVLPTLVSAKTGRLHTSFNQTITATGRLSSSSPNLQNIPIRQEIGRAIRKAFVADKGYVLLSADYSQIELRIIASLSGDEKMCEAFKKNVDIHTATAAEIHGIPLHEVTKDMRRAAKEVNFGILYGMGPQGLSESTGISFGEAQSFIEQYFLAYPGVRAYLDRITEEVKRDGYVQTLFGRRRYVPEINSQIIQIRNAAIRAATNMPIQGTEADIIKLAMIAVHEKYTNGAVKMILQVHDELLFEIKEDEVLKMAPLIRKEMESVATLSVPIVVDLKIGPNWGEMERMQHETHNV